MAYPLLELGGAGPVVHFAPANGFPAETYGPIFESLARRGRVVSLPPRALWDGVRGPPEEPASWERLADDLLAGLDAHRLDPVILVGHSFGGVVSLLASLRDRRRCRALALLDPTMLGAAMMERLRAGKATGWKLPHPVAARARERRALFESPDEAFTTWRRKRLFRDWSDQALRRYVDAALRPSPSGWSLRWSPAWEAYYYEGIDLDIWDRLGRLDPSLPILVVGGETSDTFGAESRERFRVKVPWAAIVTVPGHGHLFPLADPLATADILDDWLSRLPAPRSR